MDNSITFKSRESQESYGRGVAILMALKPEDSGPNSSPSLPREARHIRKRLQSLSQDMTSSHADLLELLVRFDELEGWKCNGSKHCAAWMNFEIGISVQCGWEYLRVGRKLRTLKTLRALFRVGKISWSKVRLISRVADASNESLLCHAALDASVSDVKTLCEGYRWHEESDVNNENTQALQQWLTRSLTWSETSNGSTRIQITLPTELAQTFLNSVEQSINETDTDSTNISQRRADAAVMVAEKSLQSAGREIATADRYQVVVSVDAKELQKPATQIAGDQRAQEQPPKRATLQNAGAIAKETARRIACDCSISINQTESGEATSIGRKSRVWPAAMVRAIKDRDQVCVWPGCIQSRHLHIHHIKHWADGGETSIGNGACLCSHHHTMVHEGGYSIVRADSEVNTVDTQFFQQLNTSDSNQFDFETTLRSDWNSFDSVRQLMPLRYRFRIMDRDGNDIGHRELRGGHDSTHVECRESEGRYHAVSTMSYPLLEKIPAPPAKRAAAPMLSSIRKHSFHLAMRSERENEPTFS